MSDPFLHGVVVVDKPVGPTSFDIVNRARRQTGARKVGHGGTLDPLASGVLPLCFGEGTKLAQFLLDADKEYQATIQFGWQTDTDDAAGAVTVTEPADHLSEREVATAMRSFVGHRTQIPPMYSALKRDGRPLYAYARAGETVERSPRDIRVLAFDLLRFLPAPAGGRGERTTGAPAPGPAVDVHVRCTKGTYIRTLARDLGTALGTAAHLAALRRTRSGPFHLAQAITPDSFGRGPIPLISPADALADLRAIHLDEAQVRVITQGKAILWSDVDDATATDHAANATDNGGDEGQLVRFLTPTGALVAVARRGLAAERIRTLRVFGVEGRGVDRLASDAAGSAAAAP